MAPVRAAEALVALRSAWPAADEPPRLITGDGALGHLAAVAAGYPATTIGGPAPDPTTAGDTRRLAAALAESVDLLLFAGGDGTARDVLAAVDPSIVALGVPAGVKIQSAVFATSPAAAGRLAAAYLASGTRRTAEREVIDLDEDAYRRGEMASGLHGYLRVPLGRRLQPRKSPSPASDAVGWRPSPPMSSRPGPGPSLVLGPGTTIRSVAQALGVPKTLAWRRRRPRHGTRSRGRERRRGRAPDRRSRRRRTGVDPRDPDRRTGFPARSWQSVEIPGGHPPAGTDADDPGTPASWPPSAADPSRRHG